MMTTESPGDRPVNRFESDEYKDDESDEEYGRQDYPDDPYSD